MNEYTMAAQSMYSETQSALRLLFENLNQGQQNKLLKNENVRVLLVRYGIVDGGDG